jgi:LSD1 subclass zinc finger protein
MAQLICGGCRTLLMYTRNADTVRCSCCHTINLVRPGTADSVSIFLPALCVALLHFESVVPSFEVLTRIYHAW